MLKLLAVAAVTILAPALSGVEGHCAPNAADELVAGKVSKLPAIDGKADDDAWKTAKEVIVKMDVPDEDPPPKKSASIKAIPTGTTSIRPSSGRIPPATSPTTRRSRTPARSGSSSRASSTAT
jgi:hypothetical protein